MKDLLIHLVNLVVGVDFIVLGFFFCASDTFGLTLPYIISGVYLILFGLFNILTELKEMDVVAKHFGIMYTLPGRAMMYLLFGIFFTFSALDYHVPEQFATLLTCGIVFLVATALLLMFTMVGNRKHPRPFIFA